MTTRPRQDPYRSFNFILELDGAPLGGFTEVSGLSDDLSAVDDRAATEPATLARKLPALGKVASITLQRGAANRKALFEWQAAGADAHRHATIVLRDESRQPVARWRVANAWPTKVVGPSLSATGNDVAIELLELTHEGVTTDP
jgi:phage tail-like protein